jgi:hypothetical protein
MPTDRDLRALLDECRALDGMDHTFEGLARWDARSRVLLPRLTAVVEAMAGECEKLTVLERELDGAPWVQSCRELVLAAGNRAAKER